MTIYISKPTSLIQVRVDHFSRLSIANLCLIGIQELADRLCFRTYRYDSTTPSEQILIGSAIGTGSGRLRDSAGGVRLPPSVCLSVFENMLPLKLSVNSLGNHEGTSPTKSFTFGTYSSSGALDRLPRQENHNGVNSDQDFTFDPLVRHGADYGPIYIFW